MERCRAGPRGPPPLILRELAQRNDIGSRSSSCKACGRHWRWQQGLWPAAAARALLPPRCRCRCRFFQAALRLASQRGCNRSMTPQALKACQPLLSSFRPGQLRWLIDARAFQPPPTPPRSQAVKLCLACLLLAAALPLAAADGEGHADAVAGLLRPCKLPLPCQRERACPPPSLLAPAPETATTETPVVIPEIEWADCPFGLRGVACNACWNDTACVDVTGRAGATLGVPTVINSLTVESLPTASSGIARTDTHAACPSPAEPQGPTRPGATTRRCSTPKPPRRATRAPPRWAGWSSSALAAANAGPSVRQGGSLPATLQTLRVTGVCARRDPPAPPPTPTLPTHPSCQGTKYNATVTNVWADCSPEVEKCDVHFALG